MAVCMSTLIWEQTLECRSGMVIFYKIIVFYYIVSRKLFEPTKFRDSDVSQIFRNFFFKNPSEFGVKSTKQIEKEFKDKATLNTQT